MRRFVLAFCLGLAMVAPAMAQQTADDGFTGSGAALCVAAGEAFVAEGQAPDVVSGQIEYWRQVLHVMAGTEERRRVSVEAVRASLESARQTPAQPRQSIAQLLWTSSCADPAAPVRYMAVHGSEDRIARNIAEEGGVPIDEGVAAEINRNAGCLAATGLFLQPRPRRALRRAFERAEPPLADRAALVEAAALAAASLSALEGSTVGKTLLVDYLGYIFEVGASGDDPQAHVNGISGFFQDQCSAASGQPAQAQEDANG